MRRIRRTSLVALVWATAASMLLGATPHFTCKCPDGTIKEFCPDSASGESSCCCGGRCCGSKDAVKACCSKQGRSGPDSTSEMPCCRGQSETRVGLTSSGKPIESTKVEAACCQRTLAQPVVGSLLRIETKSNDQHVPPVIHVPVSQIMPAGDPPTIQARWTAYGPPPPTDLVKILQRLTI